MLKHPHKIPENEWAKESTLKRKNLQRIAEIKEGRKGIEEGAKNCTE